MAVVLITAVDTKLKDDLTDLIFKAIIDAIKSTEIKLRHIEINELGLKGCIGKQCKDKEYRQAARMGCAKIEECIDAHNREATNEIYNEIVSADALIYFIVKEQHSVYLFFKEIFNREMEYHKEQREKTDNKRYFLPNRLSKKQCMVVFLSEQPTYASGIKHIDWNIGENWSSHYMNPADFFLVNNSNYQYMKEVIPFAVTTLITKKEETVKGSEEIIQAIK